MPPALFIFFNNNLAILLTHLFNYWDSNRIKPINTQSSEARCRAFKQSSFGNTAIIGTTLVPTDANQNHHHQHCNLEKDKQILKDHWPSIQCKLKKGEETWPNETVPWFCRSSGSARQDCCLRRWCPPSWQCWWCESGHPSLTRSVDQRTFDSTPCANSTKPPH